MTTETRPHTGLSIPECSCPPCLRKILGLEGEDQRKAAAHRIWREAAALMAKEAAA